jgi:pyrroloquinoline quinone (PQQ) biosynthesis protein C
LQIVELENQVLELTKDCELKEQQLQKLQEEVKTFKDFLEVTRGV